MQCLITMKAVSICVLQENGFPKEDYNWIVYTYTFV
jgi:hypothetical protein